MAADAVLYGQQDPNARLDWGMDWTPWLEGDEISTSTWAADAPAITLEDPGIQAGQTFVWVSGGALGGAYRITNQITTVAGRVAERTIHITIVDQ